MKTTSDSADVKALNCIEHVLHYSEEAITTAQTNIDKHPKENLFEFLRTYGMDLHDFSEKAVRFTENGVDLITSKGFKTPLSLHRAIYIDTPMAVNDNINFNHWNGLIKLMTTDQQEVSQTIEEKILKKKLQNILYGDITIKKDYSHQRQS